MEDRYEIKGKIAQGGLGSVYKAHDVRMSRDVAIKRIITNIGDTSMTDEATRQLIKEASALASLQHPNIVTIYDVGKDADGPFVVMELLSGQTLEEIITQASFTWEDFRQLAMQCLEALIAAQELHIVHRDIKPGNIMLTWLPSGKFQVKVVDFGLAKHSAKPSLQTIDQSDGVFGSIYFMGPEQFERIPIDQRVDLYAIGCVFYYALTGTYPFDGDSAVQVMASHLQHHVTPIQEVRAGIPIWACDWIMWLINRQPSDRPESAREALHVFMQNDSAWISPQLSTGEPTPVVKPETSRRPKLFIPGAAPEPEIVEQPNPNQPPKKTASASRPLSPPHGSKASVHITTQSYEVAPTPATTPAPEPQPEPIAYTAPPAYETPAPPQLITPQAAPPQLITPQAAPPQLATPQSAGPQLITPQSAGPQLLTPQIAPPQMQAPAPSAPAPTPTLVAPTLVAQPASSPTQPLGAAQARLTPTAAAVQSPHFLNKPHITHALTPTSPLNKPQPTGQLVEADPEAAQPELYAPAPKKPIPNSVKVVIAIVLSIIVIFLVMFINGRMNANKETAKFNEMIKLAAKEETTEILVDKDKLFILLRNASTSSGQQDRSAIYRALILAKASDKTEIDREIAEYSIKEDMFNDIRIVLLREVLGKRKNPAVVPTLVKYSETAPEPKIALAAIEACREMANEAHFNAFLDLLKNTSDEILRKAAEDNLATIISKSNSLSLFRNDLISTYKSAPLDSVKHATLRLLGRVGGEQALALVKENLKASDQRTKVVALGALGNWVDSAGFDLLITQVATEPDPANRKLAFDAAIKCAATTQDKPEQAWRKIAEQSTTPEDQIKLINGLAAYSADPWVFEIINNIIKTSKDPSVLERAKKAVAYLEKMKKDQGK